MLRPKNWKKVYLASLAALLATATAVQAADGVASLKGSVKSIAQKSKTVAVTTEEKSLKVFKFTPETSFVNAASSKEILPGDNVSLEYRNDGAENVALSITRVIPRLPQGVTAITLAELEPLVARGEGSGAYFLVDARPSGKYAAGHLPGAHSVPFTQLEQEGAKLLPEDKGKLVIFYCGGVTCGLSHKSAALALKLGYSNVKVYVEGEPGWVKAEHYTVPSVEYLKSGGAVLVDLREAKQAAQGRIPGAVNVPLAQLEGWEKKFPLSKSAPIVFYGGKEADLVSAIGTARDWGYTNVAALPGGVKEWQGKGNPLEKGAGPKEIAYKKSFAPQEIGSAEFQKGIASKAFVVVDVRTPEEFAKSHINSAINVPAEEISRRYRDLPADKALVLHCSTGARAEMAYELVKDKGLKVKYVNATVEFEEDGSYKVGD